MDCKKSSAALPNFNVWKMPFEHSSVLIEVALDGIGRHLWMSYKGETPIEGVKLIGSFQKT